LKKLLNIVYVSLTGACKIYWGYISKARRRHGNTQTVVIETMSLTHGLNHFTYGIIYSSTNSWF
jgi:hypothetical protein